MTSRLAKKYATNKKAETEGILYEEIDNEGPLFQVRIGRLGAQNNRYRERLNELMKPYRRMKQEDIPYKTREKLFLQAFCETVLVAHSWKTYVDGNWADGIEDPSSGVLLPATSANYQLVLEKLPELSDRLVGESTAFDNFKLDSLEAESKN